MNVFSYDNEYSASIAARTNDFTGSDLRELVRVATLQVCFIGGIEQCSALLCMSVYYVQLVLIMIRYVTFCRNMIMSKYSIHLMCYYHDHHYRHRDLRMLSIRQEQRWKLIRKLSVSHCPSFTFLFCSFFRYRIRSAHPLLLSILSSPFFSFLLVSSPFFSSQPYSHLTKFVCIVIIIYSSFLPFQSLPLLHICSLFSIDSPHFFTPSFLLRYQTTPQGAAFYLSQRHLLWHTCAPSELQTLSMLQPELGKQVFKCLKFLMFKCESQSVLVSKELL